MAAFGRIHDHLPGRPGVSGDHLDPVHRGEHTGNVGASRRGGEGVARHVIGVGPGGDLRVVAEISVGDGELPAGVRPGGIRRRRDRDALVVGAAARGRGELRDQPAVGHLVVNDHRIARVLRRTGRREAGPERADVRRAEHRGRRVGAAVERPDLVARVDRLDELVVAHRPVAVGRRAAELADAEVIEPRRRRRRREPSGRHRFELGRGGLDDGIGERRMEHLPGEDRIDRRLDLRRLLLRGRSRGCHVAKRQRDVEPRCRHLVNGLPGLVLELPDRVALQGEVGVCGDDRFRGDAARHRRRGGNGAMLQRGDLGGRSSFCRLGLRLGRRCRPVREDVSSGAQHQRGGDESGCQRLELRHGRVSNSWSRVLRRCRLSSVQG